MSSKQISKVTPEEKQLAKDFAKKLKIKLEKDLGMKLSIKTLSSGKKVIIIVGTKTIKEPLPNEFRAKIAKILGVKPFDWDDVQKLTIMRHAIELSYDTWKKIFPKLETKACTKDVKASLKKLYFKDPVLAHKAAKVLGAKINTKLQGGTRNKINKEIGKLTTPKNKTKYFDKIPLQDIFDILDKYDIVPLQEDNTEWDGFLTGREGEAFIEMAPKNTLDNDMYTPYTNAGLKITWYKIKSGKYEVLCYVS